MDDEMMMESPEETERFNENGDPNPEGDYIRDEDGNLVYSPKEEEDEIEDDEDEDS